MRTYRLNSQQNIFIGHLLNNVKADIPSIFNKRFSWTLPKQITLVLPRCMLHLNF